MGYPSAVGIANSDVSLEQQLSWHFSANCYPPVPSLMIPVAIEAIEAVLEDGWETPLDLPEGVSYRGATSVTAGHIIDGLHLHAFIDSCLVDLENEEYEQ